MLIEAGTFFKFFENHHIHFYGNIKYTSPKMQSIKVM